MRCSRGGNPGTPACSMRPVIWVSSAHASVLRRRSCCRVGMAVSGNRPRRPIASSGAARGSMCPSVWPKSASASASPAPPASAAALSRYSFRPLLPEWVSLTASPSCRLSSVVAPAAVDAERTATDAPWAAARPAGDARGGDVQEGGGPGDDVRADGELAAGAAGNSSIGAGSKGRASRCHCSSRRSRMCRCSRSPWTRSRSR